MKLDWDSSNRRHLARHKITPQEFDEAMERDILALESEDVDGEERWLVAGSTKRLRILILVFTPRENGIRPITAWEASRKIRERYFREVLES